MSAEAAREDACREYQSSLEDLTFNSKPHINMLTILAEENIQFTKDIVAIIEAQIAKAPPAEKLPVLYLVDSIVKNVGGDYLEVFAKNLITSFICVFEKVDENTRKSLFKLRSTWDEIFPLKKLYALDVRVNSVDPAWPIKPLPPNVNASIHVNPKFLKPTEELASPRAVTPQPQVHSKVSEKNLTQEQIIRQQLLAKQKQLLELQQKKIELELEQTKAQLAASTNHPPVGVQVPFDPVPVVSQSAPTPHTKPWPPAQAEKVSNRDPRLNRGPAISINPKEQGTYKKENPVTTTMSAPDKKGPSNTSKLMRIPKKDTSATEDKARSKSVSPSSKGILNKSRDIEGEHTKSSDVNKKDPRLRKQVNEKIDPKEEDVREKKRTSEKRERDDAIKGNEQQRSTTARAKLVNGSLNKHERLETFQKQEIKVNKANIRKRSRSRSRSPAHSPKRKERRSPKRRTRSITPPQKFGKSRQLSKHLHTEDSVQQLNTREERSTPKKSSSEQRRLKRPLEDRLPEHRDAQPQRISPAERKNLKDVKKWKSGWDENKPLKQPEPELSHGKPGPQRHKTWGSNPRPATQRTTKQHRLSVDANLQIPDVLNSASKRDLLRKASQRMADGELSQEDFLNVAHQIKQLFQYQEERQRSDSWEGSSDDGSYPSKKKHLHGHMSDAELSYLEHKSKLKRTQLQRPAHHSSPLSESVLHHKPQHEEDDPFIESSDAHKRSADAIKPFLGHDDPRRNDRPPPQTGTTFRNTPSPVNCDIISGKSSALPFERPTSPMELDQLDDGEISPRFESPNSVHSGTDNDGPLSSEAPSRHDLISGPGRGGRNHSESPGQTPPHSSEGPTLQANMLRHDGPNIPPRFDGHKSSHSSYEVAHGHMGQPRPDGLSRPQPLGRYEGNTGAGRYDVPGGHGPSRYDGHSRYDAHGPNRFERPPLLKGPGRYDDHSMSHGPVRFGEPHSVGRFDGPGSGCFDGAMGHQGPGRFDGQGPVHYENSVHSNRFEGSTRFDNPHMPPGPPGGFDGPMRYPSGPVNYEGQRRIEGPGSQAGIMHFDNPVQPVPIRFDAQPSGISRYDSAPQVPPRYRGPANMQNSMRPQGQTLFDQPQGQSQGPMLNPGVPPPNFNVAPPNAFPSQPQPFHIQQNVSQASNFNVPGSTPSTFQNSYRPVAPFPTAAVGNLPQPMGVIAPPGQTFIPQNPVPFNPSSSQFVQPESHLGQMDVNDLVAKLISTGIIKPTQTDSSSESPSLPQSQSVPEEEEPEDEEQDDDENLPDLTGFVLDDMKQRYESVITKLYTGIQCYSCGMRFTASQTDVYADHLDWHYRQNRSEKDISKKITHRRWYYSLTDWIEFEEIADLEERAKSQFFEKVHEEDVQKTQEAAKEREFQSVKAAPDVVDESCEICQEQFEMYWEEEEEEWHLKNAIRVDGKTYHPSCYEDYKNTSSFVDCTPSPNKMLTENPLNAFLKQEKEGEASCSSIKEEPAEVNIDAVTVTDEVQVKLEGVTH
ncbi:pre-mRNA cleavage complex 2 protein Pcf11 [Electrophorus electricus]|uniref:pre-mRNA cleavage complex 2 protein Pcf11 n=1 Tax=Electrophorus electricus TaxID=8005 RepID=UPI0015D0446E|nr:pre-mRNA cleavage complex 2 protein Pcf11 [Electrophorus electricus]